MLGDYTDTCDPQLRIITEHETMQYCMCVTKKWADHIT